MERSPTLLSIAWIPALLLIAGVWSMALGTWLQRQVSPTRLAGLTLRIHVGAAVLALLLAASIAQVLGPGRPVLVEAVGAWIEIGRGLALRADLVVDPLAGALLIAALLDGVLIELASAGRPGGLPRASVILAGLALLALSESLVGVALGSHLIAFAALTDDDRGEGRAARALGELGLWIALGAIFAASGALGIAHTARVAALGTQGGLALTTVGGASLATVAALGLGLTVLGRAFGARATDDPGLRALLWGPAWTLPVAAILLRLASVIALSPSAGILLGVLGALAWGLGALQALRAGSRDAALVGLVRSTGGLLVVLAAASAWSALAGVALVAAGALAVRALALGPRRAWALALGEAALLVALGYAAAALVASPWGFAAALPIAAAGIGGAALGRRSTDAPEIGAGEALVLLIPAIGLGLATLAAATRILPLAGPLSAVDAWIAPAIAPASPTPLALPVILGMSAAAAALFAVGGVLGRRREALPERAPAGVAPGGGWIRRVVGAPASAALGLQRLLDHARGIGGRRLWFADAFGPPATVLGLLAGLLLTLGAVYCNPQVLRLGPSRVHPVDLGGLDPFIVAPKRSGRTSKMDATDFAAAAAASAAEQAAMTPPEVLGLPREGAAPGAPEEAGR